MGKIRQTVRRDGLRIITKRLTYTKKVMLSVTSLMGAACDAPENLGIAHYFEHMLFQGTKTRDTAELTRLLDLYCISHNADTSHLRTRYYGEAALMNYEKMAEVILDFYCNPIFPEDRIENERGVINNEIVMRHNNDGIAVFENLTTLLYGEESLAGRGVAGSKETVATVNRDLLVKMHKEYYSPANSVVIMTGDVPHSDAVKLVNKFFPLVPGKHASRKNDYVNDLRFSHAMQMMQDERLGRECAYLCLGTKLANGDLKDRVTLNILAKYFRKIIYTELREKRGLVYSASAGLDNELPLYSIFYLYAQTAVANLEEVKKLMLQIMLDRHLFEKEFEDIKLRILAESSVCMETSKEWNNFILHQIVSDIGELSDVDKYFELVSEVLSGINIATVERMFYDNISHGERLAFSIVTNKVQ